MINVEDREPTAFLSISNTAAKDWKAPPESLGPVLCGCKQTMVHNPFNKMITFHVESHQVLGAGLIPTANPVKPRTNI